MPADRQDVTEVTAISEIVFDSLHPAGLARFWACVLTEYEVRPYDEAEIQRLAAAGFSPETDPAVAVDGPGPTLFFQKTELPKRSRNRVHLDLEVADRSSEVRRICALGAQLRDEHTNHSVLLDPEGNEFCLRDA